jgi:hypothetical protein
MGKTFRSASLSSLLGVFLLVSLSCLGGCKRRALDENDPAKRLAAYISASFNIKEARDRDKLTDYLTGSAKSRLSAWSDEQFRQAFVDGKRTFLKLLIRESKQVSPQEMNITYELVYLDQTRGSDAKVTNKKMSVMVLENGRWFIKEVKNLKELVEYKNELALP